jgi:hypothetical protein
MARKSTKAASAKRPPVESLDQFDAMYLPMEAPGGKQPQDDQIGLGLVSHVLRDFRRTLRAD